MRYKCFITIIDIDDDCSLANLRHLENPTQTLEAMLRPKVATLPGHIQAVYVQNAAKLFATVLKGQEGNTDSTAAQETSQLMIDRLPLFVQSANLEVQERVRWREKKHCD